MIRGTRHDEQQVGKAVQVHQHDGVDRVTAQSQDGAFRTAADRARQVERRTRRRTAGQDEMPERRQLRLQSIDPRFEPRDAGLVDHDLRDARRDLVRGIGEPRPEREQIALQRNQHLAKLVVRRVSRGHAERRLQFVDVTVGGHARIGLGDTGAVEQARLAAIAGFRVDFHSANYKKSRVNPYPLPVPEARQRFRRQLLTWYRKHGRDLPWRKTDNPYHILVSEIMLQQTQVDRVLPKYHEWLAKYPSFEALAAARPRDVTRTWYPLGYNIRPRRLQSIAREAVDRFGGTLPSDEDTLLSFQGIGRYTAGAIRSFAFRERAAIVDTNVARLLARVFLGHADPKSHAVRRRLWQVSATLVPRRHVFDFNQALMDFGAIVCTARKPRCGTCPMRRHCRARASGRG